MEQLPKIKCSNCSVDIDILQLADHICATSATNAPSEYFSTNTHLSIAS